MDAVKLARFLGWFSIGLGAAEILAGRSLGRWLGMERRAGTIRLFGLREVANGAAILGNPTSSALLWARVGGDALDLATLGSALVYPRRKRINARLALGAVAGITLLDILCASALAARERETSAWRPWR
ncbi:hypothetical protein [Roseomonas sp. BN140053]|uniref:hypothetical protein n=1 Tax=Roseomonas sp. BN140053 TaxID=3391898 RepID=UPI0039E79FA8